jgi:hypothetical protein
MVISAFAKSTPKLLLEPSECRVDACTDRIVPRIKDYVILRVSNRHCARAANRHGKAQAPTCPTCRAAVGQKHAHAASFLAMVNRAAL